MYTTCIIVLKLFDVKIFPKLQKIILMIGLRYVGHFDNLIFSELSNYLEKKGDIQKPYYSHLRFTIRRYTIDF